MIQWSPFELGTFCLNSSDTWRSSAEMPLSFSSSCSCEAPQGKDLDFKKANTIRYQESSCLSLNHSLYCNFETCWGLSKTHLSINIQTYSNILPQHLHFNKSFPPTPAPLQLSNLRCQVLIPGISMDHIDAH